MRCTKAACVAQLEPKPGMALTFKDPNNFSFKMLLCCGSYKSLFCYQGFKLEYMCRMKFGNVTLLLLFGFRLKAASDGEQGIF